MSRIRSRGLRSFITQRIGTASTLYMGEDRIFDTEGAEKLVDEIMEEVNKLRLQDYQAGMDVVLKAGEAIEKSESGSYGARLHYNADDEVSDLVATDPPNQDEPVKSAQSVDRSEDKA